MAHTYSEDDHFDSFTKRARKASDMKVLERLRKTHGSAPHGGDVAPPMHDEMPGDAPDDSMRPSDENGPHPDGCRCADCKMWMAGKKGGHHEAGEMAGLSGEDADALMRG